MAERYEGVPAEHLEMILDDIRTKMQAAWEHGNALDKGYPYFQMLQQRLEVELAIDKLKEAK